MLHRDPVNRIADTGSGHINVFTLTGLVLCIVAFWMLQHPYEGVVHDSILYSFSALARLHPESLNQDIYLSVGSQDRYTLFSPLVAAAARGLGIEQAAALLTLIAELGFFVCGWLLARGLVPGLLALLCAATLVMLPSDYGAKHIFSYVDPFMTPRLPAEALVLACLAATLTGRQVLSAACLVVAALLHPLMAASGAAMLFVLYVGIPRPRLALTLTLAAFLAVALVSWLLPLGPIAHFSPAWFNLLYERGTFLFPTLWPATDWPHVSVPLAVLALGAITAHQPQLRRVCIAALVTGIGGVALAVMGSDLLHIVILGQAQPWRWLWLANALAALLTPAILLECWRGEGASRVAAVLLAAAWVSIDETFAPGVSLAAMAAALTARHVTAPNTVRLMMLGAWAVFAVAILVLVGFVTAVQRQLPAIVPDPRVFDSPYLLLLRQWKPWISGGIVPVAVFLGTWWIATRTGNRVVRSLAPVAVGMALCLAFGPFAWKAWTRQDYPREMYSQFSSWRAQIPPRAQVLWFDFPFATWYLLERPNYWSRNQNSASIFSEELTRKLAAREEIIVNQTTTSDAAQNLKTLCQRNPELDFFVSTADAGPSPVPSVVFDSRVGPSTVRLYACATQRS